MCVFVCVLYIFWKPPWVNTNVLLLQLASVSLHQRKKGGSEPDKDIQLARVYGGPVTSQSMLQPGDMW